MTEVLCFQIIARHSRDEGKNFGKVVLKIKEVAVEGKMLNETAAGQSLEDELRLQRQRFEAELLELKKEIAEVIQERDREAERMLRATAAQFEKNYDEADPTKLAVDVKRGMRCIVM